MNRLLKAALPLAILGIVAAAGVWYFVIRSDSPAPVSLESALDAAAATPAAGAASTTSAGSASSSNDGDLTGKWKLVSGASFAGYRVQEELVGVGATTAVGRTTAVTGTLDFTGSQITAVEVTADLTKLQSDKSLRDGQLRTQAIETNKFPTATFKLTSPIAIAEVPQANETVTQKVKGDLTLHGVTKAVEIEVQGALKDGRLVVVGSTVIQFADYNIAQPRAQSVLSIEDKGIMELQLIFEQA